MPKLHSDCSDRRKHRDEIIRESSRGKTEIEEVWCSLNSGVCRGVKGLGKDGLSGSERGGGRRRTGGRRSGVTRQRRGRGRSRGTRKFGRSITLSCYPNLELRKLHGNRTDILWNLLSSMTNSRDSWQNVLDLSDLCIPARVACVTSRRKRTKLFRSGRLFPRARISC